MSTSSFYSAAGNMGSFIYTIRPPINIVLLLLIMVLTSMMSLTLAQGTFITPFERSMEKETTSYLECIDFYVALSKTYQSVRIKELGTTDSGFPLHVVMYNLEGNSDYGNTDKIKILVLNAIHPGEPAGVDASMMLLRDLAAGELTASLSRNLIFAVIPVYNIGGSLERGRTGRANQNGPEEYGFRGNSRNLDLNRDFMKMDSKNTFSFVQWFHEFDPEIFVDTHTSNGADYQYIMTYVETHPQKLGGTLGAYLRSEFTPMMLSSMKQKGYEMCPFVNVYGSPPDDGFRQFYDTPRYSTGYAALFQTLGYMSEAHMLKSFEKRVRATYAFLWSISETGVRARKEIKKHRSYDRQQLQNQIDFTISWEPNGQEPDTVSFKGYKADFLQSKVTSGQRLYYDHKQPVELKIPYFNKLIGNKQVSRPKAYILRQAWDEAIEKLRANGVAMSRFEKDTLMSLEVYHIDDYRTYNEAFEGHYLHYNTLVRPEIRSILIREGDYYIDLEQPAARYLIEALEPEAVDSFFNWNIYDSILQQKEYFSDYVFEETAEKLLAGNKWLKDSLEYKRKTDPGFRIDPGAQLSYIYKHSEHAERNFRLYPVFRVID